MTAKFKGGKEVKAHHILVLLLRLRQVQYRVVQLNLTPEIEVFHMLF